MFKITFSSLQSVNLVLAGLGEMPAKVSMSLIQDIQRQVQEQLNAAPQEKTSVPEPPP